MKSIFPVVLLQASWYHWAPSVVFGCAAVAGSGLSLLLPESRGKPLMDSVEELERIYKKQNRG